MRIEISDRMFLQLIAEAIEETKKKKRVVRQGKIVKKTFCPDGMKAQDGKCVRMKPQEKIHRAKQAKKAAKKRKAKKSVIARKTKISKRKMSY